MKTKFSIILVGLLSMVILNSCSKKPGCMDPTAANYDPEAEADCCCQAVIPPSASGNTVHSGTISTNETWANTEIHELAGKVVVESGAVLTIQPGTIIKGRTGTGSLASALIIAKGGQIMAEGTALNPIIFTSTLDNITYGQLSGTNLDENDNEKWGGLILLGDAPVSTENGDTQGQIEGIPAEETYGLYGGSNATDNSGVLSYISLRHGGALIGEGNEINGLTLGGVGSGTTINNIEVYATLDDGIECFGGTVNLSNVIVGFQGDDGIDIDQNYSGTISNFVVINDSGDEALEIDGPEGTTHTGGMFSLVNGSIWTTNDNGSGADLKSKAQGTITGSYWQGWTSNSIKLRASFSDTSLCTESNDAHLYLTQSTPTLTISGSEIVGTSTIDAQVDVYTKSMSSSSCVDPLETGAESILSSGAPIVGTASVGANMNAFSWTWSFANGKITN